MTSNSRRRWNWRNVLLSMAVGSALVALPAAAHPPFCTEFVNPHGRTIPPAGSTTAPGLNCHSGQNPDGFFKIGTFFPLGPPPTECVETPTNHCVDACLFNTVFVLDTSDPNEPPHFDVQDILSPILNPTPGSGGCFTSTTNIKFTQAPGAAEPDVDKMASGSENSDAVQFHIKASADLLVCSAENVTLVDGILTPVDPTACVPCVVPPPPKDDPNCPNTPVTPKTNGSTTDNNTTNKNKP
jgi:hypothetical protein